MSKRLMTGFLIALAISIGFVPAIARTVEQSGSDGPEDRIAIIIDSSESYKNRQSEAIREIIALLDGISARKTRRWEKGQEHLAVLSLDAIPEIIWEGNLKGLKQETPDSWTKRFGSRKDYFKCSDVVAAFKLAISFFSRSKTNACKYLFIFSDLIHEPPAKSISKCVKAIPPAKFPKDFPWVELQEITTSVYWIPPDQKFVWADILKKHDLENRVSLFTESDMKAVSIEPPQRQVKTQSQEEQVAIRQQFQAVLLSGGRLLAGVAGCFIAFVLVFVCMALISRWWRRRAKVVDPGVTGPGVRRLPATLSTR